jgi:crotonobetainyl-CoA:carnitine CoA-transferase CaiB-like acyl-CoA transferase
MTAPHEPGTGARRAEFLAGLRVLELGDGVAGSSATAILWALGAEVTAVVDPSSPHRRARPRALRATSDLSLLATILDRGKRLEHVEGEAQLRRLLEGGDGGTAFDVVVVDRVLGVRGALAALGAVERYARFVDDQNPGAWVTISAFGLTGERAEDAATEITVAAAGGMLATVRDEHTGLPLKLAGQQSLLNTGQAAALAACHAVDLATTGAPVHLDLSAVEATLAMGPVLEVGGLLLSTGSIGGARRYGAPASFYACTDGLVRISAMEDHQWNGVVEAMGRPAWADRFATVAARIDDPDEVDEHVAVWAATRTKLEAETVLQSHGVPATAVSSPAEILSSPQLAHRDAFERLPVDEDHEARVVGLPFRVVAGGEAASGRGAHDGRRRSLQGLRMLEASRVLAVPLAGAILGVLGAEVTKLEDLPRLDMYRRRGPYIDGEPGMERSAYFALMNHSKASAGFDADAERDRLESLLADADVVIENLGRKRATALGLAPSSVVARHPDVLALSSSGFGQDGPHAEYRAYAYNLQAACALGYLTRTHDGESAEIDIAWADLIAAYALATIIAAWTVGPKGNAGVGLDFAMADLIVGHFNDFVAAASLDDGADAEVDRANDLSPYAPHGVYPAVDGWVALAVEDDDEFARLAKVLRRDSLLEPVFAGAESRLARRRALDVEIAAAIRDASAVDLAAQLRAAGVIAEPVLDATGLLESAQLAQREFFVAVEHSEWGSRRLVGIPWRPFGGPPLPLRPPPLLTPDD